MSQDWSKSYNRINWVNSPSTNTPIDEINLNKVDYSLDEVDNRIIALDNLKANEVEALHLIDDVSFNPKTGTFTFTRKNKTTFDVNTLLEKIIVNFNFDDDPESEHYQNLVITMEDGTVKYADMSSLITMYEFDNSEEISFFINENGHVSANIIDGSITDNKLRPDYLADVKGEVLIAEGAASTSVENSTLSKSWAVGDTRSREGEDYDNAKYYAELAKNYKDQASAIAGIDFATPSVPGIIAYDGTTISKTDDGRQQLFAVTASNGNKGIMQPDGRSVSVDDNGILSVNVDGDSIIVDGNKLSAGPMITNKMNLYDPDGIGIMSMNDKAVKIGPTGIEINAADISTDVANSSLVLNRISEETHSIGDSVDKYDHTTLPPVGSELWSQINIPQSFRSKTPSFQSGAIVITESSIYDDISASDLRLTSLGSSSYRVSLPINSSRYSSWAMSIDPTYFGLEDLIERNPENMISCIDYSIGLCGRFNISVYIAAKYSVLINPENPSQGRRTIDVRSNTLGSIITNNPSELLYKIGDKSVFRLNKSNGYLLASIAKLQDEEISFGVCTVTPPDSVFQPQLISINPSISVTYSSVPGYSIKSYLSSKYIGFRWTNMALSSKAVGFNSIAQGNGCQASGDYSIASGNNTKARGKSSIAFGDGIDNFAQNSLCIGSYNESNGVDILQLGNGTAESDRHNAMSIDRKGNMNLAGSIYKYQGVLDGRLVADGDNIELEDGASYMLTATGYLKSNNNYRGMQSYVISAPHKTTETGITTTTNAVARISQIGTDGTACISISKDVTEDMHAIIGLGSCTTDCHVRYSIFKICGSEEDFM